jgi:hypothetical protein
MNLLNLAHPITPKQREQIAQMAGQPVEQLIDVRVQFDLEQPFVPQVVAMFDGLGIPSERWQGEAWLVALPSLNYIAALVLAELHGRMGHFPAILRLRPVAGALVTEYEVAEIVNLEQVRQAARARR